MISKKFSYPSISLRRTGENIRDLCYESGFTVKEVQRYLGIVNHQTIYNWFSGRFMSSLDNLVALSRLFEIPLDIIIVCDQDSEKEEAYSCFNDEEYVNECISIYDDLVKKEAFQLLMC